MNFNARIIRGLRRRQPDINILLADKVELGRASDPELLAWAAENDRVILTHDANTLVGFAVERILQELPMPGVIVVARLTLGAAIEDIALISQCAQAEELRNQIWFLPL